MNLHTSIRTALAAEHQSEIARAMCRQRLTRLARQCGASPSSDLAIHRTAPGAVACDQPTAQAGVTRAEAYCL